MAKIDTKELEKAVDEVNAEYEPLIAGFRPQFGNPAHIALAKQMADAGKLEKTFRDKMKASKGGAADAENLIKLRKQIIQTLKSST